MKQNVFRIGITNSRKKVESSTRAIREQIITRVGRKNRCRRIAPTRRRRRRRMNGGAMCRLFH